MQAVKLILDPELSVISLTLTGPLLSGCMHACFIACTYVLSITLSISDLINLYTGIWILSHNTPIHSHIYYKYKNVF